MNNEIDVKIERIIAIKETLAKLLDVHTTCNSSSRLSWIEEKIDILIEELKNED